MSYVLRRLAQAIPVLVVSSILVFLILRLVPGDPAMVRAGPAASPETVAAVRQAFGLDQPLPVQYLLWLGRAVHGDFGVSFISNLPASALIAQRVPATIELALAGALIAILVGVSLGVLAIVRPGGSIDWIASVGGAVVLAIPNFWLGMVGILVFALALGWLPPGGRVDPATDPLGGVLSLLLPAAVLGLHGAAVLLRATRSAMLNVLSEDHIRATLARGVSRNAMLLRHALRNASVPIVTMIGIVFGRMLGGVVVIEVVFSWPGLGRLLVQSISNRDYNVVQAELLLIVVVFVLINLVVDLLYVPLDPRIRLQSGGTR